MSTRLALHLLGAPRLELDNVPIIADRRKVLALLAYLAINRWQHHRDHISALFWPDYDQSKAYANLRHILWEVGQLIGEGWIAAHRDTIGFNADEHLSSQMGRVFWLDVARFKALLAENRSQKDVSLRIARLTDCVNLYRNHFLTGFITRSPSFNEWAFAQSEDLSHQFAAALTRLSEDHCSLGQVEAAIPYTKRLINLDPLNEASHRQLMRVYIQAGQHNAALKQYQTCEQILRKELGVDPHAETRDLYRQIRKGEIKPVQKDKQRDTILPGNNIPFQISSFIGREKELGEVKDLIANHRLVSLVGAGGIGKTRLSLKVGEYLIRDYSDGIWFVELASLSDPALVPQTVARLLHIVEQAEESLTEKLIRVLRPKTALLILDNCEHLLDACAQLADTLLKHCPNLKILSTSREHLGITGEAQYHVPPLELPDLQQILEKLLDYESIQLFEGRARLIQEHFSLTIENAASIAQICQHLDGIPLAIELAAARVNLLSPEQIASQLGESLSLLAGGSRTALPRHQTLHACIEWSWNLLSEPEQALMRRLAVFAGGWTLEAAEAVGAGDGIHELDVFGLLDNLIEKSLVSVNSENGRYRILETVRQYASENFHETDEAEVVRNRHLAWVLTWAEEIKPKLHGQNQIVQFKQAEAELDNVRAAMEHGLSTSQRESSMRIYCALSYFLDGRYPSRERRRWLEIGLSMREYLTQSTLAKTLSEAALVAFRQNDPETGIPYAQESLALAEVLQDHPLIAYALHSMTHMNNLTGDFTDAERNSEREYVLYQKLDDKEGSYWQLAILL